MTDDRWSMVDDRWPPMIDGRWPMVDEDAEVGGWRLGRWRLEGATNSLGSSSVGSYRSCWKPVGSGSSSRITGTATAHDAARECSTRRSQWRWFPWRSW